MSKYHCKCGGLILPDFDSFQVGDEVKFMLEKRKPLGDCRIDVRQKALTGTITKIEGDDIHIKSDRKKYVLFRYGVTSKDAPGPIEYFRFGKCRCELDMEQK